MAQNNDGPGKRLKREEAKNNILYVNRPDDPRLRAYQDSASTFNNLNKFYEKLSQIDENKFSDISEVQNAMREIKNKYPFNSNLLNFSTEPFSGPVAKKFNTSPQLTVYKDASATAPKRKVIYRPSEPISPIKPRQASLPKLSSEIEFVAPIMRPQKEYDAKYIGMGSNLRYPSQDFISKVKARMTGEPLMPYWIDAEGVKRYPSMGENNPEEVKMMEMLKDDLSPNNPEDAVELERIELLRKMSPKDRRKFMDSDGFAQK